MAEITAGLVKDLREKTGTGMMDCKKALQETGGDLEAAVDWLRKKGLAAAAKKAGRVAAEGLVAVATADTRGAVVEINSETDFVARNADFQAFVAKVASLALECGGDLEALKAKPYGEGRSVDEQVNHMIATIGENMNLRRCAALAVDKGVVTAYIHNAVSAGMGKIGVLVALESAAAADGLAELGKQLAMHVAATSPLSLSRDRLDPTVLERERAILTEQARASGKPENIIEKMVEGRLRKFYEEVCLLDQTFVIDGETLVSKVLENRSKEVGQDIVLKDFARFKLGEGVEREQQDFAAEVAAAVSG